MHGATQFLVALTVVLGVAAVTTLLFQYLRLPVVLGYILAGVIIGPHVPIPLVADTEIVHTLSELGVILLMFGLGLEFSLRALFRSLPTAGTTALLQCSVMVLLGYLTGQLLGWTSLESFFCGAIIAISSTTIIAKAFDEQGVHGKLRGLVVAILIVEDLIAVVLIAVLTGVSSGQGLSASELALTLAKLMGFLLAVVGGGLLVVPRAIRVVVRRGRPETTIITAVTLCFGISLLAHAAGYSVALGAFVAGVLVAESGEARHIEPLVHPVRDVFAAVFFVSVGIMIDPSAIAEHWLAIIILSMVVIVGKFASVAVGAFLVGSGTRTSIAAGMSLAQIGEFSFIIAGVGLALGAIGSFVYPIAVAVSAITTLTTPLLIRAAERTSQFVDRKLPAPLQTFVAFYEGWIARLANRREKRSAARRHLRWLLVDVIAAGGLVIGFALGFDHLTEAAHDMLGLQFLAARIAVVALAAALALPLCIGIVHTTGALARLLAETIVPRAPEGEVDLGNAARRMLVASLQLASVAVAGLTLAALTVPFVPVLAAVTLLIAGLVVLGIAFWRSARGLHGHVRAASLALVEVLAAQAGAAAAHGSASAGDAPQPSSDDSNVQLPGLGWKRVTIAANAPAVGRSLAELSLRGSTGATVLAIIHEDGVGQVPDAHALLQAGDVLALTGSDEAIESATAVLARPAPS